jgi:hypothetical protein
MATLEPPYPVLEGHALLSSPRQPWAATTPELLVLNLRTRSIAG